MVALPPLATCKEGRGIGFHSQLGFGNGGGVDQKHRNRRRRKYLVFFPSLEYHQSLEATTEWVDPQNGLVGSIIELMGYNGPSSKKDVTTHGVLSALNKMVICLFFVCAGNIGFTLSPFLSWRRFHSIF